MRRAAEIVGADIVLAAFLEHMAEVDRPLRQRQAVLGWMRAWWGGRR